jgi:hypothetical protein
MQLKHTMSAHVTRVSNWQAVQLYPQAAAAPPCSKEEQISSRPAFMPTAPAHSLPFSSPFTSSRPAALNAQQAAAPGAQTCCAWMPVNCTSVVLCLDACKLMVSMAGPQVKVCQFCAQSEPTHGADMQLLLIMLLYACRCPGWSFLVC